MCLVDMTFGYILNQDGSQWEYYRCPMTRYVTFGKENLTDYLRTVDEQTHPCYVKIAPEKFNCAFDMSMVLAIFKSEKNPGRLYLKCFRKSRKLFQWLNKPPKGLLFHLQ